MTLSASLPNSINSSGSVLDDLIEEITARIHAGQPVEIEAYVQQHPEHADALRRLLPALQVLADLGRSASEALTAGRDITSDTGLGTLGDFRILREIGRGGMGVVYEAEQISLGRRVALKMLPFAATMDSRQLQRFQNEARAAASLEHPHIVPVYGVGCERGVHYYAMKYIDGQSLAQVVGELTMAKETNHRDTEDTERKKNTAVSSLCSLCLCGSKDFFKSVAELGIQAAEALEHAHSVGIVHRDIKPANLLIEHSPLTTHHSPKLWITDFGLARTAADAGLTMTGDVLGTLRYMSPEQALAKHGLVDHRTDIYSLGVTFYEVLTGRPAVDGKDREQILNAITLDEPRPPRTLDPAIPQDFETIVLKAMAKNAEERYATARELADDLRRLLENRPIQAKSPSRSQRVRKWAQRHRVWVNAATLVLLVTTLAAIISFALIWRAYQSEGAQRLSAEQKRRLARQAVDKMYTKVAEKWLNNEPGLEQLQREFLEEALGFYKAFSQESDDDPTVSQETGSAHRRVAQILEALGRRKEAEEENKQAIEILQSLAAGHPEIAECRGELAECYKVESALRSTRGDNQGAINSARQAVDTARQLDRDFPGVSAYRRALGSAHSNLGLLLFFADHPAEADEPLRQARSILEELAADEQATAEDHVLLGGALSNSALARLVHGDLKQARAFLEQAITHEQKALELDRRNQRARSWMGKHYSLLADVFKRLEDNPNALKAAQEALRLSEEMAAQSPDRPGYRGMVASNHRVVGQIHQNGGRTGEAVQAYRSAIQALEGIKPDDLSTRDRELLNQVQVDLSAVLPELGEEREAMALCEKVLRANSSDAGAANNLALRLANASDPSMRDAERAVSLARTAARQLPKNPGVQATLGIAFYRNGDYPAAKEALEKSCELAGGTFGPAAYFLAMTHWRLNNSDPALEWYRRASKKTSQYRATREITRARTEAATLLGIKDAPVPNLEELAPKN